MSFRDIYAVLEVFMPLLEATLKLFRGIYIGLAVSMLM